MFFEIFVFIVLILILIIVLYLWLLYTRLALNMYFPINTQEDLNAYLSNVVNEYVVYNSSLKQYGYYNKKDEFIALVTDQGDKYLYHVALPPTALLILDHYFGDETLHGDDLND